LAAPVAALPVWANAENVNVTAAARRIRRSLLFIGSVELLGTCLSEPVCRNMLVETSFLE
jgi:hypothetical protein